MKLVLGLALVILEIIRPIMKVFGSLGPYGVLRPKMIKELGVYGLKMFKRFVYGP